MSEGSDRFFGESMDRRQFLRRARFTLATVALSAGASSLLSACGGSNGKSASAGLSANDVENASGTVKALVWSGYENEEAFASLEEVSLKAAFLAANEDTITKTKEEGAFDAVTIYQGMIDPLRSLDRIAPIDTSLLQNYGKLYPFFRQSEAFRRDGKVYGVPYTWGTMMMAYNANEVEAPKTFDDLMAPSLKGKISMPDDAYAAITTFARYAGLEDANQLTPNQLDQVMALLGEFKPQVLSIASNYGELPAMYSRGEIVASVPDWTPTAVTASSGGVKVETTIPEEGAFSFVDSWMIIGSAENPGGAYAIIDQAISAKAQATIGKAVGLGVVNPEAVPELGDAVAKAWRYEQLEETFSKAPLYRGVPVEKSGNITTYQDWTSRWEEFKAA